MIALICFVLTLFALPFKSKSRLEAENAALRHQAIVLQRRVSGRAVSAINQHPRKKTPCCDGTRPELCLTTAAAQRRTISVSRIRLDRPKSGAAFQRDNLRRRF
jgi:hypothetical protein